MNKFNALKTAKGFENVQLLDDGGCTFERRFFFRTINAKMDKNAEFVSYVARLNILNCILICLGSALGGVLFIAISGIRTKENLKEDIGAILKKNSFE